MEGRVKGMRKWAGVVLFCALAMGGVAGMKTASADEALDDKNFPDASLRTYLAQHFDDNGDKVLSTAELQKVTRLNLSKRSVRNLKGVELLSNLQVLECDDNAITSIDVSRNRELAYLDCSGNRLSELNVEDNRKLETLICYSNGMGSLNLGDNEAIQTLDCSNNHLLALQVEKQINLASLDVTSNQLLGLDLSKNAALEELLCGRNDILELNLANNGKLKRLNCSRNELASIELPETTALNSVVCDDNNLSALNVGKNTGLRTLQCANNKIMTLDVANATRLETLKCDNNLIASLNLANSTRLLSLECGNNRLAFLNLGSNVELESADVAGNERSVYVGEDGSVDLEGMEGFEVGKAKNWSNASVTEGGKVTASTNGVVTFTYEMAPSQAEGQAGFEGQFQWNLVRTKEIVLGASDVTMSVSDALELTAETLGGAEAVTFATSDASVVTVANNGTLTAVSVGEATITVEASGYDSVTCKVTVQESIKSLSVADIPVQILTEGGSKPEVKVTCNDKALTSGKDFDVTYLDNEKVGTATVIITGKGYYTFELIKEFRICYDIAQTVANAFEEQVHTGKELTPTLILMNGSVVLKQDVDYSVTYSNNKNPGTAIITVKGMGDYTGEKLMTFTIKIPQVTGLKKTGNKAGSVALSWNKVEGVDGYRVYKYNATTKKYDRLATVKGSDVVTYTDATLESGKTYRYKVRAMTKVDGTNMFGAYTKVFKTACKMVKPVITIKVGKAGTKQAKITWAKLKGASGYRVYMKEGKTGAYTMLKSLKGAGKKKYTAAGLGRGKVYYFRVRAFRTVAGTNIYGTYCAGKKANIK